MLAHSSFALKVGFVHCDTVSIFAVVRHYRACRITPVHRGRRSGGMGAPYSTFEKSRFFKAAASLEVIPPENDRLFARIGTLYVHFSGQLKQRANLLLKQRMAACSLIRFILDVPPDILRLSTLCVLYDSSGATYTRLVAQCTCAAYRNHIFGRILISHTRRTFISQVITII